MSEYIYIFKSDPMELFEIRLKLLRVSFPFKLVEQFVMSIYIMIKLNCVRAYVLLLLLLVLLSKTTIDFLSIWKCGWDVVVVVVFLVPWHPRPLKSAMYRRMKFIA